MSKLSKKLARTAVFGIWTIASMALAGQAKTSAPACYDGDKAVPTAKTQEECQKLGEKHMWMDHGKDHEHGKAQAKAKGKVKAKTEAKAETKPAETTTSALPEAQPESQAAPASEAPKK